MGTLVIRPPSATRLLDCWEAGQGLSPARRALLLLSSGAAETPVSELEDVAIGERDRQLLRLREVLFGAQMAGHVACPECREQLEFELSVDDLRVDRRADTGESIAVTLSDKEHRFRLPSCADAIAVARIGDGAAARNALAERCCLGRADSSALPSEFVNAFESRALEADPQADMRIQVCCPACGHTGEVWLDIGEFLWREISVWARRTLREIHLLASAYGWREDELLALSASRRNQYLSMVVNG